MLTRIRQHKSNSILDFKRKLYMLEYPSQKSMILDKRDISLGLNINYRTIKGNMANKAFNLSFFTGQGRYLVDLRHINIAHFNKEGNQTGETFLLQTKRINFNNPHQETPIT